jgi:hypothetical protein
MQEDEKLKVFEYAFDYHWGALWWGAESLIRCRFENWHENDRKGHPLLSLRKTKISALRDFIPMLAGTSIDGKNVKYVHLPIQVTADKTTDFGTQIESNLIFADDFMYHNDSKEVENDPLTPVWKRRSLWPNFEKLRITESEDKLLQNFLAERKRVALDHGGYNQ